MYSSEMPYDIGRIKLIMTLKMNYDIAWRNIWSGQSRNDVNMTSQWRQYDVNHFRGSYRKYKLIRISTMEENKFDLIPYVSF